MNKSKKEKEQNLNVYPVAVPLMMIIRENMKSNNMLEINFWLNMLESQKIHL